jgi:signal transduction histidine kinase
MTDGDHRDPGGEPAPARHVGQLMRMTAHDLRTPLSAMGVWLEASGSSTDPQERARLDRVLRDQMHLIGRIADDSALCGTILDGGLRLDPLYAELGSMLRAAVDPWRPGAERRGLALELGELPESWVCVDHDRMRHALVNFAGHAIRRTRQPGPWRTHLSHRDGRAVVRFQWPENAVDEMKPLAEVLRPRDPEAKHPEPALGLALAWEIVALHDGRVATERDDRGVWVAVEVPLRARE